MYYIKRILKFLLPKKVILILKKIIINYDLRKYKNFLTKKFLVIFTKIRSGMIIRLNLKI